MNPRGFILGLSVAFSLIAGAFILRDHYNTVVAFFNASSPQTAAASVSLAEEI
jgi:hypothetical protein